MRHSDRWLRSRRRREEDRLSTQPESFDDFFRREQVALVRYAALLAGSVALGEDLVQDVLVRIYQRWDRLGERPGDVVAYARRAITNEYLSHLRRWHTRRVRAVGDRLPDVIVEDLRPTDLAGETLGDDTLWNRVQALPARQRAALILRYYQDLTDAEIAQILRCRPGSVRSLVSRGLGALRSTVGWEGGGVAEPGSAGAVRRAQSGTAQLRREFNGDR